jgi:hypothetical protein
MTIALKNINEVNTIMLIKKAYMLVDIGDGQGNARWSQNYIA